jgi:hypothetical protein
LGDTALEISKNCEDVINMTTVMENTYTQVFLAII